MAVSTKILTVRTRTLSMTPSYFNSSVVAFATRNFFSSSLDCLIAHSSEGVRTRTLSATPFSLLLGAEREHLASVVSSAVNVRSYDDITTLTAAAATALRGAATLKARALKEMWNISDVTPLEKSIGIGICGGKANTNSSSSTSDSGGEIINADNFLSACSQELLARGTELLKRTRKGSDLHWKIVSVYIHRTSQVMLKMKSRHVAGTITKKKKNVVLDVCMNLAAWPGRHLLENGEKRRYFGLKTESRGLVEFECRNQREYELWTQGVSRLLSIVSHRKNRNGI
ncbi:hypothetical protein RYX36_009672 [Vicia faba]